MICFCLNSLTENPRVLGGKKKSPRRGKQRGDEFLWFSEFTFADILRNFIPFIFIFYPGCRISAFRRTLVFSPSGKLVLFVCFYLQKFLSIICETIFICILNLTLCLSSFLPDSRLWFRLAFTHFRFFNPIIYFVSNRWKKNFYSPGYLGSLYCAYLIRHLYYITA